MSAAKNIYLIDDDFEESMFFKDALDEVFPGCNFTSYISANDFINRSNDDSHEPDMYFLDINMPGMNGMIALKHMREKMLLKAPIIMYSNGRDEKQIESCQEFGANLYFIKPTNYNVLKHKINDILSFDWCALMLKGTQSFVVGL